MQDKKKTPKTGRTTKQPAAEPKARPRPMPLPYLKPGVSPAQLTSKGFALWRKSGVKKTS